MELVIPRWRGLPLPVLERRLRLLAGRVNVLGGPFVDSRKRRITRSKRYIAIPGSRRDAMPDATRTGPCDPKERMQVTVVLRERPLGKRAKSLAQLAARG